MTRSAELAKSDPEKLESEDYLKQIDEKLQQKSAYLIFEMETGI
ncbi:MAG: hypothetical protein V8R46_05350 [Eubacterium ramulus]